MNTYARSIPFLAVLAGMFLFGSAQAGEIRVNFIELNGRELDDGDKIKVSVEGGSPSKNSKDESPTEKSNVKSPSKNSKADKPSQAGNDSDTKDSAPQSSVSANSPSVSTDTNASSVPADKIRITLRLKEKMWWKGISMDDEMVVEGEGEEEGSTGKKGEFVGVFSASKLKDHELILWKAKTFGIHTAMYEVTDAAKKMQGGKHYIFT